MIVTVVEPVVAACLEEALLSSRDPQTLTPSPSIAKVVPAQPETRPKLHGPGLPSSERLQWYLPPRRPYSRRELLLDQYINFTGAALSWPCACLLGYKISLCDGPLLQHLGYLLHAVGLIAMLNLSALYHYRSWEWEKAQRIYSPLDQVGINLMIIGGFAPLQLACEGYRVMLAVVLLGVVGISLQFLRLAGMKFRVLGKHEGARWTILDWVNVLHYVLMALMILPDMPTAFAVVPPSAIRGMITGGTLYMIGVPFLLYERMEFHNAYWHMCVLVATGCFYCAYTLDLLE